MPELGEFPQTGWSHSRQRDLDECPRRYYLKSFGSWRGWCTPPDHPSTTTYLLKNLTTLPMALGIRVHEAAREVVQRILRGEDPPDYKDLFDRCWADLVRLRSGDRTKFEKSPKRSPLLLEQWYGIEEDLPSQYEDARILLGVCLENLLESDILEEIAAAGPDGVLLCDAVDAVEIPLSPDESVTVWAAPDLAYWSPARDLLTIVDWKTGSTRGAEMQLATYAVYLRQRFRVPFTEGRIRGRVVALSADEQDRTHLLTRDDLIAAHARIRAGVDTMRGFLADERTTEPLPKWEFPMADGERRRLCSRCSFAQICGPERPRTG